MNNILSYCGLVDTRISASEKDLAITVNNKFKFQAQDSILEYFGDLEV